MANDHQINYNWFNEPFAVSQYEAFILGHAWLSLWDKHMTTGRINQVARPTRRHAPSRRRFAARLRFAVPSLSNWQRVGHHRITRSLFLGHSRTSPLPGRPCRGRLLHSSFSSRSAAPTWQVVALGPATPTTASRLHESTRRQQCCRHDFARETTDHVHRYTRPPNVRGLQPSTLPRTFLGLPRCHRPLHDNSAIIVACAQRLRGHHGSQRLLQFWRGALSQPGARNTAPLGCWRALLTREDIAALRMPEHIALRHAQSSLFLAGSSCP